MAAGRDIGHPAWPSPRRPPPGLYARRAPGVTGRARSYGLCSRAEPLVGDIGPDSSMVLDGWSCFLLAMVLPEAQGHPRARERTVRDHGPVAGPGGSGTAGCGSGSGPGACGERTSDGRGEIATTGREFEPSTKATGDVVFVNRTGSEVAIPAGTVVSTATGDNVGFITTSDGKVAPGGRAYDLPIEAQLPGVDGNVPAGMITDVEGSLALYLVVSNESDTTGGNSSEVAVVTDDDKSRLQAQLFEELKQQAFNKLTENLAPGSIRANRFRVVPCDVTDLHSLCWGCVAPALVEHERAGCRFGCRYGVGG